MNNGISISTLLVVGLLVYLLFRSQNANATNSTGTGTASNSNSEDNSDNNTGNNNSASAYGLQQDPMEDSAKKTGERIGNHKWPSTNSELADAKAGWKEAILIWKEYANANDTQKKKKYKNYVGLIILSVKDRGSKGLTFTQRYEHLKSSHGDPAGVTNGAEWKHIWNNMSADDKTALAAMNTYAGSTEYIRWYQEMD